MPPFKKPARRETPHEIRHLRAAFAAVAFAGNTAFAVTTDDVKWINQCVNDNKGGATQEVVLKY
ncbi:MAG TPA: hypothetical protein VFC45_05320 [Pseudolabrys sp.]|nr:hypothetical protein [Pseudolabrys sp.]